MSGREWSASIVSDKMPLITHLIRFGEPGRDFGIYVIDALETEGVEMISRRKSFDAREALIFQAARQDDVAVDPVLPDHERGKAHPHLKRDPRFLGQDFDGAVLFGNASQFIENRADVRRLPFEMRSERVTAASVRLVPIRELPAAIGTTPHCSAFRRGADVHSPQR
jgi:hypothetical protein